MKFTPFTFKDFPEYDAPIEDVIDVTGSQDALRVRIIDVPYQEDRIIRFLIPHAVHEGMAPWGTPYETDEVTVREKAALYPLLVHVQGSGWMEQNMYDHVADLLPLALKGYVVAIVQYHEAPENRFPQQVIDTKRALRFLQAHAEEYSIDSSLIFLSGDSSGGHTMLLTYLTYHTGELDDPDAGELPEILGAVDFYGVTDFSTFENWWNGVAFDNEFTLQALLGEGWNKSERINAATPVAYVKEGLKLPPLLILHGSKDTIVPFTQSLELYKKLKSFRYPVKLVRVKGGDHGGAVFFSEPMYREVEAFLDQNK